MNLLKQIIQNMRTPAYLQMHTDGAIWTENKPGQPGIGQAFTGLASIARDEGGAIRYWWKQQAGPMTNNEAEYAAAILGLEHLLALGVQRVDIYSDSQIMVEQMRGRARVNAPNLRPVHARLRALTVRFQQVRFYHIPRECNRLADALANEALVGWPNGLVVDSSNGQLVRLSDGQMVESPDGQAVRSPGGQKSKGSNRLMVGGKERRSWSGGQKTKEPGGQTTTRPNDQAPIKRPDDQATNRSSAQTTTRPDHQATARQAQDKASRPNDSQPKQNSGKAKNKPGQDQKRCRGRQEGKPANNQPQNIPGQSKQKQGEPFDKPRAGHRAPQRNQQAETAPKQGAHPSAGSGQATGAPRPDDQGTN